MYLRTVIVIEPRGDLPGRSFRQEIEKELDFLWCVAPPGLFDIYHGGIIFARICFDSDREVSDLFVHPFKGEPELSFGHFLFRARFGEVSDRIHNFLEVG